MRKAVAVPLLVLSYCAVGWVAYRFGVTYTPDIEIETVRPSPVDLVLDGDTVVVKGKALHILGIDAPELGPWANCWAEAALAGPAKKQLELILLHGSWKVLEPRDGGGSSDAVQLVREGGGNAGESMVVGGFAAETTGRWNWCERDAEMRSVRDGQPAPHGPNVWWPKGTVFDQRAND